MAFQFRIQLQDITKPPVWRRILVPADFTFEQLHLIIQESFGWGNYHHFLFSPGGYGSTPVIADPTEDEWDKPALDASRTALSAFFTAENQKFTYVYDFGDDWIHNILLEKIVPETTGKASCLAGKGACPPENCGGVWGYERLKEILKSPKHPEYKEIKAWIGIEDVKGRFHPETFDLENVNKVLFEIG